MAVAFAFAALRKLGRRLWVPHQAAFEYQRNRAKTPSRSPALVSPTL
ncbi:TPA: PIN-like domain-containing protein [Stenotrophomonas maltophilia]